MGRFKNIRVLLAFFAAFALLSFALFSGCSVGDGGLKDWQTGGGGVGTVNVRGKISAPVYQVGAVRTALALPSLKGTRVFVESNQSLGATTDDEGNFFITGVPAVSQRFVAYVSFAGNTYKQRSMAFGLDGKYETIELASDIKLAEANHSVQVHVSDVITGQPVSATLSVWGFVEQTLNGFATVGPFPQSTLGEEVKISAVGYKPLSFNLNFNDENKAELYVKLTPLTAVSMNQAPVVNISHKRSEVGVNESISLAADGFDPDGDAISWSWQVNNGKLSNDTGAHTVFTAPPTTGNVLITLFGKDASEAESRAVLSLSIVEGSAKPHNPGNRAPLPPTSPIPENGKTNLAGMVDLRWECTDPDKDRLYYDVYLAKQGQELLLVGSGLEEKHYLAANLEATTYYIWQIVARDEWGAVARSAVWQFRTGDLNNNAPNEPANPYPLDGSLGQLVSVKLTWVGGDPDGNRVAYYVYMGADAADLRLLGETSQTNFALPALELGQRYYWQIMAIDSRGKERRGEVWSFTTHRAANQSPSVPVAVSPGDGELEVPLWRSLEWETSDPDGDTVYSDVYFGTREPLPKVAEGLTGRSFVLTEPYAPNTGYFWQIVAKDEFGGRAESPIWSFVTAGSGVAPTKPAALLPADGATDVALRPTLSWQSGGDGVLKYDVYFGDYSPLDLEFRRVVEGTDTTYSPNYELNPGTRYYWKIVVRDEQGLEAQSDEFSFWTKAEGIIDNTPPQVVSLYPADKAEKVELTARVNLVFSEPVVKAVAEAGFSFEPIEPGVWTWLTDQEASFTPTNPWQPGSYHKFKVATNAVQDLSGNIMHQAHESSFTMTSAIPVPAGFKSAGFPMDVKSNENRAIPLAGLGVGKSAFGVAVASADGSLALRQSARPNDPSQMDFHAKLRYMERQLTGEPFPEAVNKSGISASARPSMQVGDTDEFNLVDDSVVLQPGILTAQCMVVSDHFLVFKDESVNNLNSSYFTSMRNACENNIYPALLNAFGQGPAAGPNGESRITILITNKISSNILGFFYSVDMFRKSTYPASNERKIIYINSDIDNDITLYGVIAHEMQHMINFYHKNRAGVYEEDWINEGLSKYAEEIAGYGLHDGDDNTVHLIALSQRHFGEYPLTDWDRVSAKGYGLSYLFVKFLSEDGRYKSQGTSVTRALVQSNLAGINNVSAVTNEDFLETLGNFGLCLYINDHTNNSPQAYGLKGLNLSGNYNGVSMPGFTYELSSTAPTLNLRKHGIVGFRAFGNSTGLLNLRINPTMNTKVYLFDQRP